MDTLRICRRCHTPIPVEAAGPTCPECGADFDAPGFLGEEPLTAPTPADLAPLFPGLEILEVAGQGGMGTIYKARQPQLNRLVALKILSPELGRDPAFAQRFSREAQALAKLNHSNIVNVFDFGQAGGFFYFLMEYVDGVTLRTLIDQKQVHAEEAQRIVIEICHALQFAHEEGIVHRDIKPSNILLDKKWRVKIADFGLARLMGKSPGDATGSQTLVMGTPHYMAPEQVERPHKVDRRADIYSLGVVLYEMLTGELPLGHFEPPSCKAGVDPRLDDIVMRALAKSPRRRYQDANEFRSAVEDATGYFRNLPGDMPRSKGRRKWKWLPRFALGAGGIWLVVVTFLLFKDRFFDDQKTVVIPAGALEAFAAGPEGVGINRRVAGELKLSKEQTQGVNRILRRKEREFRDLELRHTERSKNAAGHLLVTINPFPTEMDELLGRMWSELGAVLTTAQLATAKDLHFEKYFPHSGKQTVAAEIWQDESGYHYQEVGDENHGPAGNLSPRRRGYFLRDNQNTTN